MFLSSVQVVMLQRCVNEYGEKDDPFKITMTFLVQKDTEDTKLLGDKERQEEEKQKTVCFVT